MDNRDIWVTVYGAIFNEKGEVLIVRRAPHDMHPNMWELPGGSLEYGEKVDEAVKREVKEEVGLDVKVRYPVLVHSGMSTRIPDKQVVRIAFDCKLFDITQPIQLSPDHVEHRWMSLEEKDNITMSEFLADMMKNSSFLRKLIKLGK